MRGILLSTLIAAAALGTACDSTPVEPRQLPGDPEMPRRELPLLSISLAPASATIQANRALQMQATTRTLAGGAVVAAAVTWTSTDPSVATVSADGLVQGVSRGQVEIVARARNARAAARITVIKASMERPK